MVLYSTRKIYKYRNLGKNYNIEVRKAKGNAELIGTNVKVTWKCTAKKINYTEEIFKDKIISKTSWKRIR